MTPIENKENYDVKQTEAGYQEKISYSYMYSALYQQRLYLHANGLNDAAINLFYNIIGDFRPLFDTMFIENYMEIIDSYNKNESYTEVQAKEQMYRLHVSEFASLMVRKGVAPKADINLQIVRDDTPKDLKEVFGE